MRAEMNKGETFRNEGFSLIHYPTYLITPRLSSAASALKAFVLSEWRAR